MDNDFLDVCEIQTPTETGVWISIPRRLVSNMHFARHVRTGKRMLAPVTSFHT